MYNLFYRNHRIAIILIVSMAVLMLGIMTYTLIERLVLKWISRNGEI